MMEIERSIVKKKLMDAEGYFLDRKMIAFDGTGDLHIQWLLAIVKLIVAGKLTLKGELE
ncbi:MAG: hypothetical protein AB1401_00580 [Thermodesulfobacteriota bacterium]